MLPAYDTRLSAHRRDPRYLLGELREAAPTHHSPAAAGWMLRCFDDTETALADPRLCNARIQCYAADLRTRGENLEPMATTLPVAF